MSVMMTRDCGFLGGHAEQGGGGVKKWMDVKNQPWRSVLPVRNRNCPYQPLKLRDTQCVDLCSMTRSKRQRTRLLTRPHESLPWVI